MAFILSSYKWFPNDTSMRKIGSVMYEWITNEAYRFICLLETYKYNFINCIIPNERYWQVVFVEQVIFVKVA